MLTVRARPSDGTQSSTPASTRARSSRLQARSCDHSRAHCSSDLSLVYMQPARELAAWNMQSWLQRRCSSSVQPLPETAVSAADAFTNAACSTEAQLRVSSRCVDQFACVFTNSSVETNSSQHATPDVMSHHLRLH
jgi:hypothetical protein